MKTFFLTFRSITQAQRAERAFSRAGMSCILRRTPRWMEQRGCGYCIRVPDRQAPDAVRLLRQGKIPFGRVYWLEEGQEPREVSL